MALESSQRELQLWLKHRRNPTLQSRVMSSRSPGTPTETISGLQLGSLEKMCHSDATPAGSCREYYVGEGGGFPESRPW